MYWWQRISRIFIQKSVLLKGQFHQIKITIFHVFNRSVDIRMCKKLCCVIDTAEARSVVSLILCNHDYWHHGHNRVRLSGVMDIGHHGVKQVSINFSPFFSPIKTIKRVRFSKILTMFFGFANSFGPLIHGLYLNAEVQGLTMFLCNIYIFETGFIGKTSRVHWQEPVMSLLTG